MTHTIQTATAQAMVIYPADYLAVEVLQQQGDILEGVDVASAVQQIRDIAESVCERLEVGAALGDVVFTLNDQLFNVLDFHTAPDGLVKPVHCQLHRVLEQRAGDTLTLGILYTCIGRWLGLPLAGCDFPGRFLVHYHDDQGEVIIDPAAGGIQLQQADLQTLLRRRFGEFGPDDTSYELISELADHSLVVRLLRRLKQAYLGYGEATQALRVQEKIMQLLPDMPGDFRERGRLYELLDCPRAAAKDYSRYIDLAPDAHDVIPLRQRLPQLISRPQVLH